MAENDNDLPVTIPEELRRQFAAVRLRLWRVETTMAVGLAVIGVVVSLLALFISDRLWDTPRALRLFFCVAGTAAIVVGFLFWAWRWIWRRRTDEDFAWIVQKKFRRLGDRLLGIVELSHEQRHQANFSPALYHAAIRQVAEEAREYDFRQSVSARPAEKYALGAAACLLCALALALAVPQAAWNTFARWIAPMSATPRYTLVQLDGLPREMTVAHGEPFSVSGRVQYRSFWKPSGIVARLLAAADLHTNAHAGSFTLQIPGQVENGKLLVRVGDATASVQINPVYRPSLQELSAQIKLPAYLQYPEQTEPVQSGSLIALEGSEVSFHGKISRALASAQMQSTLSDGAPLSVKGATFSSQLESLDGISEFAFNWRDDLGLSNVAPLRLSVTPQKDAAPVPSLPGLPRDVAVLDSDVLHVECDASDDFGVRDLGLTWEIATDTPLTTSATTEVKVMTSSPRLTKTTKTFLWSPREYRIPDDAAVTLQGFARDFFPKRERSRTGEYHIRVLSPEEHAELLREQLEGVMARMEEVTRLQEKIAANLRDVKDSPKLSDTDKSARVGQSKQDQLENAARLDQLSNQAKSAMQEAMKNPTFPLENLRQWSQSAQQWQKLSQQKMQQAAASMQSAQQKSAAQKQAMADATKQADEILKELEKMQGKASQQMDNLQAVTLAQRLRKVGSKEKDISAQLMQSASDLIGLPPEELNEKLKHFESTLTTDQEKARQESDALQGEISRFFERTQKTNYGAVSQQMKDTHATDELDKLSGMIGDNIAMEASGHLGQWSEQFQKWSDLLEPKDNGNSSAKSGSPSSKSKKKDLTKQLIALLRLRERENTLRDQTSVLDQDKGDPASFKQRALGLGKTQEKLADDLDQIHQDAAVAQLEPAFAEATANMQTSQAILETPETGKPADAAEGKTIDTLTDLVNLINEQGQQSQKQQSSSQESSNNAEEMAFLMRMMQNPGDNKTMALQPAKGPNNAGGQAGPAGSAVSGNSVGQGAAAREVNKASGVIENAPTEFRDALDNYFHGIEQTK